MTKNLSQDLSNGWIWKQKHTLLMLLGLGGVWLDHSTDLLALMAGGSLIALAVMMRKESLSSQTRYRLYLFFITCLLALVWLPLEALGEHRLIIPLSAFLLGVVIDLSDQKLSETFSRGESLNLLLALLAALYFVTVGDHSALILASAPYLLNYLREPWSSEDRWQQQLWIVVRIIAIGFLFNAVWLESPFPTTALLKPLALIVIAIGLLLIRKHPARGTFFRT